MDYNGVDQGRGNGERRGMRIVLPSEQALRIAPELRTTQQGFAAHKIAGYLPRTLAWLLGLLLCSTAFAVDLKGLGQPAAIDQPQVFLGLSTGYSGTPPTPGPYIVGQTMDPIFGTIQPTIGIQAYLDTGASGILISPQSANAWHQANSTYNGQTVMFNDIGVVGTADFTVSNPIYAGVAPYTPNADPEDTTMYEPVNDTSIAGSPLIPIRLQMGPGASSGSATDVFSDQDINVVGMPAMKNKIALVDARSSNQAMQRIAAAEKQGGQTAALTQFLNEIDNVSLKTYLRDPAKPNPVPGTETTNLHVQMSYADFSDFTTTTPTGTPGPTLTHNPFIGPNPLLALPGNPYNLPADTTPKLKLNFGGNTAEGSFLLDTGAGASFISQKIAGQLHVRYVQGTFGTDNPQLELYTPNSSQPRFSGDPYPGTSAGAISNQFTETISGVGGSSATIAGFNLDSLLVRTKEANPGYDNDPRNLNFTGDSASGKPGAAVLVLDINLQHGSQSLTLDGDFGVNFLAGSLLLNIPPDFSSIVIQDFTPGAFDWLNFDERNAVLGLQLNSAFHMKGDFNFDGKITNADIQAMLDALIDLNSFQSSHGLSAADLLTVADINGDGVVNGSDINPYLQFLAGAPLPSPLQGVPEPGTVVLMAICAIALFGLQRR